jgi:hypothetical protein
MKFNTLAWSAVCFYYKSAGDKRYSTVMSDHQFIEQLRHNPKEVSIKEFEEKAILGFVNIQNYDLLIGHKLTESILTQIIYLQDDLSKLQDLSLIECNLDHKVVNLINRIYSELCVKGLWITGASKIAHLLNDDLFPPISIDIARHFDIQYKTDITQLLQIMQRDIQEATNDFHKQGLEGTPNQLLSDKLGYTMLGYKKSLSKFADEYYWLSYGDGLPIPPKWIPDILLKDRDNKHLLIQ